MIEQQTHVKQVKYRKTEIKVSSSLKIKKLYIVKLQNINQIMYLEVFKYLVFTIVYSSNGSIV